MCGPLDMDDPQPAITVMMPDEDWSRSNLRLDWQRSSRTLSVKVSV